jgi:RNA polymerase sigma-70 factor (ECF subfamily)
LIQLEKKNKISFVDNPEESLSSLKQDDGENLEMLNFEQINAARIIELIQELPPAYRTVFNLYVIEDYSHKEISEMLNINIGTSKSNLSKAKVKLKKLFIEKYGNIYEQLG